MADATYNLLVEPIIGVSERGGPPELRTLPMILAALASDTPLEFAALQPHQFHAWHAFLTQLGALAAFRVGAADVVAIGGTTQWTAALRALSEDRDEPWCLMVPELKAPAFMQPPIPEGSLAAWKPDNATAMPDTIDLLETAKNHDVKMERINAPRPEHWVYALVALQTMQGFSGRDNYGIARMNGGVSNRPGFAAARDLAWSTRFVRDANLLLAEHDKLVTEHSFAAETGVALLWLEPWNGSDQLAINELDPFFIEVCRRLRLIDEGGRLVARWTTTKTTRIAAKELKGKLGDPWVPVKVIDGAALTAGDLSYQLVQRVLFDGDFRPSRASLPLPADGAEPFLTCHLFVRGQGKTEGYHERFIPIPPKARLRLATEAGRRELGAFSQRRLAEIKDVAAKALRPAVAALLQGGPDKLNFRDPRIDPFVLHFDHAIDRVFFAELFDDLNLTVEAARLKWLKQLLEFAAQTLARAKHAAPVPAARVWRAHAAADRVFHGASRRMLADAGEGIEPQGGNDEFPTA